MEWWGGVACLPVFRTSDAHTWPLGIEVDPPAHRVDEIRVGLGVALVGGHIVRSVKTEVAVGAPG